MLYHSFTSHLTDFIELSYLATGISQRASRTQSFTNFLEENSCTPSTVVGQNVLGGPTWPGETKGVPGEKHLKDLGIFIPEIAANASNLTTSSYIWRTHLLLLFSFHRSKIIGEGGGGGAAPPLATALLTHLQTFRHESL